MIIRCILLFAICLMASFNTSANTCKLISKTCIDNVEPKNVSGLDVYFADVGIGDRCWQWQSEYDCVDSSETVKINYCSPLEQTSDCQVTSSVCSKLSSVNGSCDQYTKTFRCGNPVSSAGNVTVLDSSYTLAQDSVDYSACDAYSTNSSCKIASETCIDGPSTKVIFPDGSTRLASSAEISSGISSDGLVKYEACWKWSRDYACLVGNYKNYCQPLVTAGCAESGAAVCKSTGWDGSCLEYERTYVCNAKVDSPPQNVTFLNSSYTILSDTQVSTCLDPSTNPNCTKAGEVCTDGPSTKVVLEDGTTRLATTLEIKSGVSLDGAVVTKACWSSTTNYTCATEPVESNCDALKSDLGCTLSSTFCVDYLAGGQCGLKQHVYQCKSGEGSTSTVLDCGMQQFCSDGKCFDTGYPPDTDFGRTIAYMEAAREAAEYNIFKGEAAECSGKLLVNCCKAKGGGQGGNNNVIASTLGTAAFKLGAESIYVYGSQYVFEGLMNSGSEILAEYAMQALGAEILSMSGTFSVWGATFSVTAGQGVAFVGFDPYSFILAAIIYVVMDSMKCSQDELMLQMRRGQGICHRVGTYCASKFLGSCTEKKESWCCFPSKLGRIINEQGRTQISKTWGTAKAPDCSGFTLDELTLLRFDQMDLSEFIADIRVPSKSSSFAVDRLNEKINSYYAQ